MKTLAELLHASAARHAHLCPRQVLGVRMGLFAGVLLELDFARADKRVLAVAETSGCLLSGIGVASGCWVERRTLRVEDYGKIAATFIDTQTRQAIRIAPDGRSRELAVEFAPEAAGRWEAMLLGYQRMPDSLLFKAEQVHLTGDLEAITGGTSRRVRCAYCNEEIINGHQVTRAGSVLCRACAGEAYYAAITPPGVLPGNGGIRHNSEFSPLPVLSPDAHTQSNPP